MGSYIVTLVSNLDYNWYLKKQEAFLQEPFYNKVLSKVFDTISDNTYYEEADGS